MVGLGGAEFWRRLGRRSLPPAAHPAQPGGRSGRKRRQNIAAVIPREREAFPRNNCRCSPAAGRAPRRLSVFKAFHI